MSSPAALSEGHGGALADDAKALLRARVLRAARHLIAERGLDVSMDDVADAAGVGRRTLFRHFESRDALVAEALASSLDWYDERAATVAGTDLPFEEWVAGVASTIHGLHGAAGRGLWQLAASDDADLPAQLAAVNRRRRERRRVTTRTIAREAWRRAGGTGSVPVIVEDAFAMVISSFATHGLVDDYGRTAEAAARPATAMLVALVRNEVESRVSRR